MNKELEALINFFEKHKLSKGAINWLLELYKTIQFFDDIVDKEGIIEKLNSNRKNAEDYALSAILGSGQVFLIKNRAVLEPLIITQFLKWIAANKAEETGQANEKSFIWRAGYYDVVLMAIGLDKGISYAKENSFNIMSLYGESLNDYFAEFDVKRNIVEMEVWE